MNIVHQFAAALTEGMLQAAEQAPINDTLTLDLTQLRQQLTDAKALVQTPVHYANGDPAVSFTVFANKLMVYVNIANQEIWQKDFTLSGTAADLLAALAKKATNNKWQMTTDCHTVTYLSQLRK